ncbi:Uncharacterised protein [Legionella steigerwaltii]|uniref:Uncharacterized protein n=2 Tax=Legionella steigerwaltii TaxID=460 RepID=A0A378LAZ1_9GAMM|nr:hypothetical protein [Legionella steigerwaltii]STY23038.1 Uncharacterised protein [Legionella steigerwaltii]
MNEKKEANFCNFKVHPNGHKMSKEQQFCFKYKNDNSQDIVFMYRSFEKVFEEDVGTVDKPNLKIGKPPQQVNIQSFIQFHFGGILEKRYIQQELSGEQKIYEKEKNLSDFKVQPSGYNMSKEQQFCFKYKNDNSQDIVFMYRSFEKVFEEDVGTVDKPNLKIGKPPQSVNIESFIQFHFGGILAKKYIQQELSGEKKINEIVGTVQQSQIKQEIKTMKEKRTSPENDWDFLNKPPSC